MTDTDDTYVASWIKLKQQTKQTDEQRYLAALYNCGEATQ